MEVNLQGGGGGGGGFLLPEDIIFDVLSRLPVKVLCRLRCVRKEWHTLISDQVFQKSRAPLIAGMFRSQCRVHQLELRVMDMDSSILRVFQDVPWYLAPTCLDLIFLYSSQGGVIVDPAAKRVLAVGEHNPRFDTKTLSRSHYSFGRAAPSGAYKVLRIYRSYDGNDQLCEIATINDYSSEPTWRQRPLAPVSTLWYSYQKATINGILYFMSYTDDDPLQDRYCIAGFSLESEEWTETIDGPSMGLKNNRESWNIALAELKGDLNMVQTVYYPLTYQEGYGHYVNIWLLINSKKSSWVKQYTIQMPQVLDHIKALDVLGDGRILVLNKKLDQNRLLYRYILQFYNPSTESFTDFMELPDESVGAVASYLDKCPWMILHWQIRSCIGK